MVNLELKHGLPFCNISIEYRGEKMILNNVLIDTGSGGSVFKMDIVDEIGITIESDDVIETVSGVGGVEFVYKKKVDCLELGELRIEDFTIEVGVMDYGFELNGIVGMDFLRKVRAVIDLNEMKIKKS